MEKLASVVSRIPLQQKLADYCFPQGSVGKCEVCGKKRHCTTGEIAVWIRRGFPKHCGRMITLDNPWIEKEQN